MHRATNIDLHRLVDFRPLSPVRSPLPKLSRPLSPIRNSPFSRPAPLSPLRARKLDKSATTPTKTRPHREQFLRSPKNKDCHLEYGVSHASQIRTIKSGVGLFQQLANEHKISSQRKENKYVSHCVAPFQLRDKKDQGNNCSVLQNARQMESIQTLKPNFNNSQTIWRGEKSNNMESTVKIQCATGMKSNVNILDSFGAPKYATNLQNSGFSKLVQKVCHMAVSVSKQQEPVTAVKQCVPSVQLVRRSGEKGDTVGKSYQQILLLIKRAGQPRFEESLESQQNVRTSIQKLGISFNMNPFL